MKHVVRVAMGLVAVASFALSFQSLMRLGRLAGYAELSALYPLVIDMGTVACCCAWLVRRSREAFWATWTLLGLSIAGNGLVHWLQASGQATSWGIITLVGVVPPATLGLCIHLAVSLETKDQDHDATPEPPAARPDGWGDWNQPAEDDGLLVKARELAAANGGTVGRPTLKAELGVSDWRARQLVEALAATNGDAR